MNYPNHPANSPKIKDIGTILSDLHAQDGEMANHQESEIDIYSSGDMIDRKRQQDPTKQDIPKKKRFCWDDMLHYRFLEFIFRYGLEKISSSKVHEMLQSLNVDIPFNYIDSYIRELRMNIPKALEDFSMSYKEAMRYQDSYSIEGNTGRFSVYPFPPPSVDHIDIQDQAINPLPSMQQLPHSTPTPGQDVPLLQSRQSITIPQGLDDPMSFLFNNPADSVEHPMDSQIQLHQDMLYQSDYMLSRNRDDEVLHPNQIDSDFPISNQTVPAPQLFSISSFLSAPNDTYLHSVDTMLGTASEVHPVNQDYNKTDDLLPNIFDFLNE